MSTAAPLAALDGSFPLHVVADSFAEFVTRAGLPDADHPALRVIEYRRRLAEGGS